jgi:uncharacterized protein (DUF305 family)
MRKFLLGMVFLVSGCGAGSTFTLDDQMFAAMMVPHHEQAIVMADIALTNSTNPAILELAADIKAAQQPEINEMLSWGGAMIGAHDGHQMAGMLSDSEIETLRNTTGVEFDRLFLKGMIKHHEGAIEMAKMVINSKTELAAKLGQDITSIQMAEIEFMNKLLTELGK